MALLRQGEENFFLLLLPQLELTDTIFKRDKSSHMWRIEKYFENCQEVIHIAVCLYNFGKGRRQQQQQ